jgi:large subunit ribosomal protein L25
MVASASQMPCAKVKVPETMATHKKKGQGKIELTAEAREVVGRKVRHLRSAGAMPAVLYGKGQESLALQIAMKDFEQTLKQAGESTLVYLHVGKTAYPTIIKDVARHPLTGLPMHADFYKVRLDQAIKAKVPVVFVGESPAVKNLGGIFVRNVNELEVQALPADMPHEIEVDITKLAAFGDQVVLKDIKIANVKLLGGEDEIIATVQEPKSEEELAAELAEPTTDVSAVEEIKPEKPVAEEGEAAPAEAPAPEKK